MKFWRALVCWIRHEMQWQATVICNHEGEFSHYEINCPVCGRRWEE